jgi:hypothetical protein
MAAPPPKILRDALKYRKTVCACGGLSKLSPKLIIFSIQGPDSIECINH